MSRRTPFHLAGVSPIDFDRARPLVLAASAFPLAADAAAVSGSVVSGVEDDSSLVVRVLPGQQCLVLTEEGRLVGVVEDVPRWMQECDLQPSYVDVARALRGVEGLPAFFLVRSPHRDEITVFEIPVGFDAAPGSVSTTDRTDLVSLLASREWTSPQGIDDRRRSKALNAALRRALAAGGSRPAVSTRRVERVLPLATADDSDPGLHDWLLRWLSEIEEGNTSTNKFRDTCQWLASRSMGASQDHWRLTLFQPADAGSRRGRLREVTCSSGTSARPLSQSWSWLRRASVERGRPPCFAGWTHSEEDDDPVVRVAAQHWDMHVRVQRDDAGLRLGPDSLYVEWDPLHDAEVRKGLAALGVGVSRQPSDKISASRTVAGRAPGRGARARDPALGRHRDETGTNGRAGSLRDRPQGRWSVPLPDAHRSGVLLARVATTSTSVELTAESGRTCCCATPRDVFLDRKPILIRDADRSTLLVARKAPLPPMVARALVLRTGLLPRPMKGPLSFLGNEYFEYQNVDVHASDSVSRTAVAGTTESTEETHEYIRGDPPDSNRTA